MSILDRFRRRPDQPAQSAAPQAAPAPLAVRELPVEMLKARLENGDAPLLLDVREPWEHNIASLPGARLMPMNTIPGRLSELDRDAEIVVYCHHGQRSWNVAAYLMQNGFTNVQNLTGGIDAWARRLDPTMRRY